MKWLRRRRSGPVLVSDDGEELRRKESIIERVVVQIQKSCGGAVVEGGP